MMQYKKKEKCINIHENEIFLLKEIGLFLKRPFVNGTKHSLVI